MLSFPHETAPAPGEVTALRPGLLWARLPLPFRLDHVNVFLVEDGDGWVVVDTGIDGQVCQAHWRALLDGPLKGFRFSGVLATHFHADHIGLAGWLCGMLDVPLLASRTTFLLAMNFYNSPDILAATPYSRFYASHGMAPEIAALVSTQGQEYMRMVSKPPFTYQCVADGDILVLGGRTFHVLTGDGHCPEQVMLYLPEERLFLAADQVMEKISPNVSVMAFEPSGDPLLGFLQSLRRICRDIPDDVLVVAGHRLPFHGLHERCAALIGHHEERCDLIRSALADGPRSAAALSALMFPRKLTPHETSFAFTEVLAHANYLVELGECRWLTLSDGTRMIAAA